jgi:hypothetical protein
MTNHQRRSSLHTSLDKIDEETRKFFATAIEVVPVDITEPDDFWSKTPSERDHYWKLMPIALRTTAADLVQRILELSGQIAEVVKRSSLTSDADERDIMKCTKVMRAAILLRKYHQWDANVLHDEERVLGVRPPGQSDQSPQTPSDASENFFDSLAVVRQVLDLATASAQDRDSSESTAIGITRIRAGTAFIVMWMDKSHPELADVVDAVKDVFALFNIIAVRADDIEHDGQITPRIIREIETAEYLFADLTGERPNVYYEVGYAHAIRRPVILFRKAGVGLHFDLASYNCPEYDNLRDLRTKLTKRLEYMTNRMPNQT